MRQLAHLPEDSRDALDAQVIRIGAVQLAEGDGEVMRAQGHEYGHDRARGSGFALDQRVHHDLNPAALEHRDLGLLPGVPRVKGDVNNRWGLGVVGQGKRRVEEVGTLDLEAAHQRTRQYRIELTVLIANSNDRDSARRQAKGLRAQRDQHSHGRGSAHGDNLHLHERLRAKYHADAVQCNSLQTLNPTAPKTHKALELSL